MRFRTARMRSNGRGSWSVGDQGDQELLVIGDAEPPGQLASELGAISVPISADRPRRGGLT